MESTMKKTNEEMLRSFKDYYYCPNPECNSKLEIYHWRKLLYVCWNCHKLYSGKFLVEND